ncbi:hypothetical protein WICMUC_005315 [Wickerhamomyces mucosus]|uniref:mRNA m(6)A methyltransferase n=1 Tax=Wickerhamomyces mucosus TaxID=1378264 RepID=A0A9P8P8Z1_9ASCO|nr:hypothetical protein WICMUC_005315 [Wickerhamomyces mucosus]
MFISINLIKFFIYNSYLLLESPINGKIKIIFNLYQEKSKDLRNFKEFKDQLKWINDIDNHSLEIFDDVIEFINHINLKKILNRLEGIEDLEREHEPELESKKTCTSPLEYLNSLIANPLNSSKNYEKIQSHLNYENALYKLTKEKVKLTTPKKPFIEICENISHANQLSTGKQSTIFPKELERCVQYKIHFVPIIKSHTDLSLGDCSYLDTCHKADTCRYVHYQRQFPEDFISRKYEECDEFNNNIPFWEKISPINKNGSVSNVSREILPAQWINCDVRTFDFNILGKFAAVIADPAWNIHMNLPYGTCNDNELLNLPLSNIQDEGILLLWVTGRAIEIGKESLNRWGYEVKNEMIWIKTNQLTRTICTGRTGHWLNHSKEHLLVGVKGNPKWLNKGIDVDVIVAPTRETSRKPDEVS